MKEQEQEEAVISNDDINSCNEFDNGEDNSNLNQISEIWGTWEELVLTCAVQRNPDWDSVAKEVQIRVRSSLIATAVNCEVKYQDLKRRFGDSGEITWLEKLRSIYVSELRRDIERCDESILSLKLKVKRLEEEEIDGDDGDKKPDLRNDEMKAARIRRETTTEENRSMNESGTSKHKYRSGGGNKLTGDKSQPLIDIIEWIRSHPHGSVFESRLRSQETKHYKSLIRQHMDIKTIEKKIKKGSYVSSDLSFYRDLKLIFTNAIVFFPKSSSESIAAQELRTLVSKEMKKRSQSVIKTEDESSVSRQKEKSSVPPLVVCKKKSSGSKKSSPSSSFKQKDEKVSEEKTVPTVNTTTTRSTRRTSKETKQGKATKNTKTESSNDEEEESAKTEKKKTVTAKKKKSVVDFLKRIEKNSPEKVKETTSKNQKKINGSVEKKESSNVKPRELRSNSKSTSKQKQTKETVKVAGKRSRESGKDDKQPKKRSKR